MMRHYRAKHENEAGGAAVMTFPPGSRKQELDEALVDFIVKDSQPFTVVSDPSFCALVAKLDPTYTLPSRQTVKAMVERRYVEEKEKAKAALQNVECQLDRRYVDFHQHGCVSRCHLSCYSC
ncbi:hypothetical protein D4764_08G0001690, partial [Takifugu flavidus]